MNENFKDRILTCINTLNQEILFLDRIIYKFKNQHGRLDYFCGLLYTKKSVKYFQDALNITFNNYILIDSFSFYSNILDLKRISRRIIWQIGVTGQYISRILSHGFFLPFTLLTLSCISRLFCLFQNFNYNFNIISDILSLNKKSNTILKSNNIEFKSLQYNSIIMNEEDEGQVIDNLSLENGIFNPTISDSSNLSQNYIIISNTTSYIKDKAYFSDKTWHLHKKLRSRYHKFYT
ncbi:hypothetical protein ACR3K2_36800 [Cryptosporidium serpentis]